MNQNPSLSSNVRSAVRAHDNGERLLMVALIVENPELGVSLRDALADRKRAERGE